MFNLFNLMSFGLRRREYNAHADGSRARDTVGRVVGHSGVSE